VQILSSDALHSRQPPSREKELAVTGKGH